MKTNPFKTVFGNDEKKPPALMAVTPPRQGERTLLVVENLLGSIAVPDTGPTAPWQVLPVPEGDPYCLGESCG